MRRECSDKRKKKTLKEKSVTRLLFVIYINDLPEHVVSKIHLFADDTKLLKKVRTQNDSVLLQNDMDGMQNWSNTLIFSISAHVLILGKLHNIKHAHNYQFGDTKLEHN